MSILSKNAYSQFFIEYNWVFTYLLCWTLRQTKTILIYEKLISYVCQIWFWNFSWFSDCPYLELIGDSYCNDESNNANCNYDGGDCCVNINTDYCSDCTCFHFENCVVGFIPDVVGDGFCNDETNNVNCYYDLGDCCGYNVNNDLCSNCTCLGMDFLV